MGSSNEGIRVNGYRLVLIKEYYSIDEVARLLHRSAKSIRELDRRDDDPMPFRCFPGQVRNGFVFREDLIDWINRNTVPLAGRAKRPTGAGDGL